MKITRIPAWVAETNAYVLDPGDGVVSLIDAPPDAELIGGFLADSDLAVSSIVLTHGHIDHTGGAGELAKRFSATTYAHPDDDFLTLHPAEQLRRMFGQTPPGSYEVPEQIESLSHQQVLDLGSLSLKVIHTPGHTPGHVCLFDESEGILFSGDQLFAGSVGRTDLPGGSYSDLMASMRDRVMTLDDEIQVLPGHGPETTIGRERTTNPFRSEWSQGGH